MTPPSTTAVASTDPRKRMCDARITPPFCGPLTRADLPRRTIAFLVSRLPSVHEAGARARHPGPASAANPRLRLRHRIELGDAAPVRQRGRFRSDAHWSRVREDAW